MLAGEIATASDGARVRLSAGQGLEGFGSSGDTVFHLPVTPDEDGNLIASVKADAVLRSATVEDRLSVRGTRNEIGKGAIVSLTTGTTAPQSSPNVSVGWVTKNFAIAGRGYNPRGWFFDSGFWYSTESVSGGNWERYSEESDYFYMDKVVKLPEWQAAYGGIAVIAGKAYVLVEDATRLNGSWPRWYVNRYDVSTGAKEAEWEYKPSDSTAVYVYGYGPSIGVKGSNLIIGQARKSDSKIEIREYTTAGTVIGSTIVTNVTGLDLYGLMYGSFDFGSDRYIVLAHDTSGIRYDHFKVLNTSGVEQTNDRFPAPVNVDGFGWDSSLNVFKSVAKDTVYRHTNITWSGSVTRRQWVAHSWFDSNTGGTGQHETLISEPQSYTMNKRAAFTVTTPTLPAPDIINPLDSVTGVRIYHGVGSTKPAASAMNRESTDLAAGVISKQYLTLNATLPANTGTPTGFPASTPATIQSSDSPASIALNGDGTATLDKVVSLRDEATNTEWLNSAGTGTLQVWNTVPQVRAASGSVLMSAPSGGGVGTLAITFPVGRFTAAPWVGVTGRTTSTAFQWAALANAPTTSGVTLAMYRTNNTQTGIEWIAVQT